MLFSQDVAELEVAVGMRRAGQTFDVRPQRIAEFLELCRAARAAEGTREHAKGLVRVLVETGKRNEAIELCEILVEEEGLHLFSRESTGVLADLEQIVPSRLSPKLPAYIPAIDLEDIPEIDLNRFLGGSLRDEAAKYFRKKGAGE